MNTDGDSNSAKIKIKVELIDYNIDDLIDNDQPEKALKAIVSLADEMNKINISNSTSENATNDKKKELVNFLNKIDIKDMGMLKKVSKVINTISETNRGKTSDTELAKGIANTCKAISEKQLELLENEIGSDINLEDLQSTSNNLLKCGETEAKPNFEVFSETAVDFNFTTPFPIKKELSEGKLEDYPMYEADDIAEEKALDFLEVAGTVIHICQNMGKSLSFTTPTSNDMPTYLNSQKTCVGFFRAKGGKIAEIPYTMCNVTVTFPDYLKTIETTLTLVMCAFQDDPFWSVSKSVKIPTNVLDISLERKADKSLIHTFAGEAVNISFVISKNVVIEKAIRVLIENPDDDEDLFTIIEIKVRAQQSFFIDFHNLTDAEEYQVVLSDMQRPLLQNFSNPSFKITRNSYRCFYRNDAEVDKYFLLAIIPGNQMNATGTFSIELSVFIPSCLTWKTELNSWEYSCSVFETTTPYDIHCRCSHISILAGFIVYADIREHQKYDYPIFELDFQGDILIISIVCFVISLYFLLSVYTVRKAEMKESEVYFLADVPSMNRHCYLISVRTGSRMNAGTSSNIVIKLFGVKGESLEHSLNYPDPLMELLQRNSENYFVLAAPIHLGQILKIHLWFDCSGWSPSWYCEIIRIIDLQSKKMYYFKIFEWFRVDGNPRNFLSVEPTLDKDEINKDNEKKRVLLRTLMKFGRLENTIWNLSSRKDSPNFRYMKRLTIALSVVLTIFMISLEFHGGPEFLPRDEITEIQYRFGVFTVFIGIFSALITYLIHILIIEGFKHSRVQYEIDDDEKVGTFSHTYTTYLWFFLVINVVCQIHILIASGYRTVSPKSWQCITSALIGLLIYIFLLDFFYNILMISMGVYQPEKRWNYKRLLRTIEFQRQYLYGTFGRYVYRPLLLPFYETMTATELMERQVFFKQVREIQWQIQDLFMITSFLFLTYLIVIAGRDTTFDVLGHVSVVKLLAGRKGALNTLGGVDTFIGFEAFMEKTLLPSVQSYQWYSKFVSENPGTVSDSSNKYLGVVRLRQQRVSRDTCSVPSALKFINQTCRTPSYFFKNDIDNYTPGWNKTIPGIYRTRLGYVWAYQEFRGNQHYGVAGYYDTGGYIALLGRTLRNSLVNFEYLKRYAWMDPFTKAVLLEFPIYNVNTNIFHFVEIIIEKTSSGYINKILKMKTQRIIYDLSSANISVISMILFLLLVLTIMIRTAIRLIKTKTWMKNDIWYGFDIVLIMLSFAWFAVHIYRSNILGYFVIELEEKRSNEFIDYFDIQNIELVTSSIFALLIGLSTLRIWKLLRFASVFRTVERTLSYSIVTIFNLAILYCVCHALFCVMGFVILGTKDEHFSKLNIAWKTLTLLSIGLLRISNLNYEETRGLGQIFCIFYGVLFKLLFVRLLIMIIIFNYKKAREFSFDEKVDYNVKNFTNEQYRNVKQTAHILTRKFRLQAGGKRKKVKMVEPKENEKRYKNCEKIDRNRMKAMAIIIKCLLLKRRKGLRFNESDHKLMMRIVENLCIKHTGEAEIFYVEKHRGRRFELVLDRRILMIAEIVQRMLETPDQKKKKLELMRFREEVKARITKNIKFMHFQLDAIQHAVDRISFGNIR